MDLTNYEGIHFQVKKQPLVKAQPIIDKMITIDSDINDIGKITNPQQGEFIVHLKPENTSFNTGEYYLVISLIDYKLDDIISSSCCNEAKYIICEQ